VAYLNRPTIECFDIVFVDPPFDYAVGQIIERLPPVLKPGAFVYLERARGSEWPELPGAEWLRRKTAGNVEYGLARTGR
jgi:16S rRNA G966 N2-methylase RsmD